MPKFLVLITEHRIYKTLYRVTAEDKDEAKELVREDDPGVEQLWDEMVDCVGTDSTRVEEEE